MENEVELISECKNRVLSKQILTERMTNQLFNVEDNVLSKLSDAANEITRTFQGSKIDVEQLANIKKIIVVKIVHFAANLHFSTQELKSTN